MIRNYTKFLLTKYWPYLLLLLITSVYFIYLINDSRFFFYDDFTGLTFVIPRTYWRVIVDSLIERDIDRHKIIGYLLMKLLYDTAGLRVNVYFFVLFIFHTINSFLVYSLLRRISKNKLVSVFLAAVFAYRFYLWWISNVENYLAGFFYFVTLHWWLSFIETKTPGYLILIWVAFPLMVYSYGPSIFLIPALIPLTVYFYGWKQLGRAVKHLIPFTLMLIFYLVVYTRNPDSLTRFADPDNPYFRPLSLQTFIYTQSVYLRELSRWLPQSIWLTIGIWLAAFLFNRERIWLLLAFLIAIASNSFFPKHTMFYYLYFPIIFILMYFAKTLAGKRELVAIAAFWLIFNPAADLAQVIFRLRHPAVNFEQQAMDKIARLTDQAIASGQGWIKLSNWDVTPNLDHAITYGAFPLWLKSVDKDRYLYSYDRNTEVLTLIPKLREP